MNKKIIVKIIILIILFATPSRAQDKKILKHRTVEISENEALIAEISVLDIREDGRILVIDKISNRGWVFSRNGELIRELDPKKCSPGFNMIPIDGEFLGKELIVMTNSGPWGHIFESNGKCIKNMVHSFRPPKLMYASEEYIYGYYYKGEEKRYISKMNPKGKKLKKVKLEEPKFPGFEYRYIGGGMFSENGYIYFSSPTSYEMKKIDISNGEIKNIGVKPNEYNTVTKDLPTRGRVGDSGGNVKEAMKNQKNKTIKEKMFKLSKSMILNVYNNSNNFTNQVVTTKGERVYEWSSKKPISWAGNGRIAKVIQPEMKKSGRVPNPYIVIYKVHI